MLLHNSHGCGPKQKNKLAQYQPFLDDIVSEMSVLKAQSSTHMLSFFFSRLAMLHELLRLQGQIHDQAGTGKRQRLA